MKATVPNGHKYCLPWCGLSDSAQPAWYCCRTPHWEWRRPARCSRGNLCRNLRPKLARTAAGTRPAITEARCRPYRGTYAPRGRPEDPGLFGVGSLQLHSGRTPIPEVSAKEQLLCRVEIEHGERV